MKKLSLLLLALLMISQTALCAPYSVYPLGDGRVEVTGTRNADNETTFLIKNIAGTSLLDVGQVGIGEDEFSKILFIGTPDGLTYNVEIGNETIQVKNISAADALAELEAASAAEFENVLISYNKIFNADTSLMKPIYGKNVAYDALVDYDFTTPQNVASEYAGVLSVIVNNEKTIALNLVAEGKANEAVSKYIGHFAVNMGDFDNILNKNLVYDYLDGNVYSDGGFELAFADALILAGINEASGDDFVALVRANQAKIGMDLSEGANIAPIVFTKVDALTLTSFEALKTAFIEENSLNKLNTATEDNARAVLESENSVLKILDTPGYSALSEEQKNSVCKAMARATGFDTIQAAKDEFALLVQRANTPGATIEPTPGTKPGGNYSVSGGSAGGTAVQSPASSSLPFIDISPSHWGYEAISSLYSQAVISGTSATTFEPERLVTREEFIKMLVATFGMYNANAKNVFNDVPDSDWCASYVASAYEKGLTEGKGDGSFGRGETLTRQDMATLASRCADIANLKLPNINSMAFTDEADFASYASDSIYKLSKAGIINGMGGGVFSPYSACTRAMAAKVCNELLKLYKGGAA